MSHDSKEIFHHYWCGHLQFSHDWFVIDKMDNGGSVTYIRSRLDYGESNSGLRHLLYEPITSTQKEECISQVFSCKQLFIKFCRNRLDLS